MSKIRLLRSVSWTDADTGKRRTRMVNLVDDLHQLERAIREQPNCRLVVIDPVSSYLGRTDSYKNAKVRGMLAPLSDLAARHGVAVLAVTHLRKGDGPAMYRAMGSLAFIAAARAAYIVAHDPEDTTKTRRLMLPVKNNLGDDRTGLAYRIEDLDGKCARVVWEPQPVTVLADDVIGQIEGTPGPEPMERREARQWLTDQLADGPRPASELIPKAETDGISKRTLQRAKADLNVQSVRRDDAWLWVWPKEDGAGSPTPE